MKDCKSRLKSYISLRVENRNCLERIERMKNSEIYPPMIAGDGSQSTGFTTDRMATAVAVRVDYEAEILPLIERNYREMNAIETAINKLAEPLEREVLRLRYIDGEYRHMPWREVAISVYGSDDEGRIAAIHRLHGKALISVKNWL